VGSEGWGYRWWWSECCAVEGNARLDAGQGSRAGGVDSGVAGGLLPLAFPRSWRRIVAKAPAWKREDALKFVYSLSTVSTCKLVPSPCSTVTAYQLLRSTGGICSISTDGVVIGVLECAYTLRYEAMGIVMTL
jgi:hypothetical protein